MDDANHAIFRLNYLQTMLATFRIKLGKIAESRMRKILFASLGEDIRRIRRERGITQPELARRVGRDPARISEFERDLINQRLGKDRLTMLAEICDALNLVPLLVPKAKLPQVKTLVAEDVQVRKSQSGSVFDDVFIDLDEQDN